MLPIDRESIGLEGVSVVRRSENFEKINFFPIQSGITVYILFDMENVIWNQIYNHLGISKHQNQ